MCILILISLQGAPERCHDAVLSVSLYALQPTSWSPRITRMTAVCRAGAAQEAAQEKRAHFGIWTQNNTRMTLGGSDQEAKQILVLKSWIFGRSDDFILG